MPFNLKRTDSMFFPEKQCRYRTRSTGYRSGQWDAHQIPCNFIMFEQLNVVAWIKMQWSCTRWPVIILDMLILWGSSQIWVTRWIPFHLDHTDCTCSPEKQCRYCTRSTGNRPGQWDVWTIELSGLHKDAMILYMITHYDTGQADLVMIMLDLRFEINTFQSQAHWLYVFTWEAMSVLHAQHR